MNQPTAGLAEAERFTRKLALSHYENFIVGGLLTPRRLRQDFYNVYAYCRMADDLADEILDEGESLRRLDEWQRWLINCYEDRPAEHPVFVALRKTIERFQIPRQPFLDLLDAFRQDQVKKRYQTLDEVIDYSVRSANPVGRLVLYLGASYSAERAELADHICTGLQLANFWQDVRRDAAMDRVYLPLDWLARFGVAVEELNRDRAPAGGRELIRALVEETNSFFERGLPLVDCVPKWLGRNVGLFVGGGMATLRAIRRVDFDVWNRRPIVTRLERFKLMARVLSGW